MNFKAWDKTDYWKKIGLICILSCVIEALVKISEYEAYSINSLRKCKKNSVSWSFVFSLSFVLFCCKSVKTLQLKDAFLEGKKSQQTVSHYFPCRSKAISFPCSEHSKKLNWCGMFLSYELTQITPTRMIALFHIRLILSKRLLQSISKHCVILTIFCWVWKDKVTKW